jgi:predicted nucleotidyltransferase component of viral defense system
VISERELRQAAARAGLGVGQAEQEYALLCVLDALGQTSPLSDAFCLKGGTALRLIYFDDWRHSVDVDFSVLSRLSLEELRPLVERWFIEVEAMHGVEMHALDVHLANGAARMRAQFVGPLRHPARLLFDVTLDELVLLPPQHRRVIASPFPTLRPVVLTYALEEILVEKMRSILQRGKSRDYYDVWRLLGEKRAAVDASVVSSILMQKCQHEGLGKPTVETFLLPQYLAEAGAYWERDLVEQVAPQLLPDWATVTVELGELLGTLLSG